MQRRLGSDQSHTPQTKVDALKASQIARRFLQQSYSTVTISNTLLEGNMWMITTNVGLTKDEIVQVKIDSKTGKILNCWHAGNLRSQIPDEIKAYQDTISQSILHPDI